MKYNPEDYRQFWGTKSFKKQFMEVEYRDHPEHCIVNGDPAVHVTAALDMLPLKKYSSEEAMSYGQAIHIATYYDDKNTLDESTLDSATGAELEVYRRFKKETKAIMLLREAPCGIIAPKSAGRVDIVADLNGWPAIIEIKRAIPSRAHEIQTAAYQSAVYQTYKITCYKRFALYLGKSKYALVPHETSSDLATYYACVTLYQWALLNDKIGDIYERTWREVAGESAHRIDTGIRSAFTGPAWSSDFTEASDGSDSAEDSEYFRFLAGETPEQ